MGIQKWIVWYKEVAKKYSECFQIIGKMIKQKNTLNNNLDRQIGDDIVFYNAILHDSIYYFKKSINIRRLKFVNDMSFFNKDRIPLDDINTTIFGGMMYDYHKEMTMKNL